MRAGGARTAMEAALAAREACLRAEESGRDAAGDERRLEAARATGSLVTPAELAALSSGRDAGAGPGLVELSWSLGRAGRIEPPLSISCVCSTEAEPGVSRSVEKLMESRGWSGSRASRAVVAPALRGDGS